MAAVETIWRGRWWLPGSDPESESEYGTLHVDENGALRLELVGSLQERSLKEPGDSFRMTSGVTEFPMIHGQAGSDLFTLLVGQTLSVTNPFFGSGHDHILRVARALRGVLLDDPDEHAFDKIDVELDYLLPWSGLTSTTAQLEFPEKGAWRGKQEARSAPADSLSATWGHYTFTVDPSHTGFAFEYEEPNVRTLRTSERATLRIAVDEPVSHRSFDDIIRRVQDLLTLSTDRPCHVTSRQLWLTQGEVSEKRLNLPIEVLNERPRRRAHVELDEHPLREALFSLHDIALEEVLPAWMDLYDKAYYGIGLLLGLRFIEEGYLETRLFTVASALESLHRSLYDHKPMTDQAFDTLVKSATSQVERGEDREWIRQRLHNSLTYRQRAVELAQKPDQEAVLELVGDVEKWATAIKSARNDTAHADDKGARPGATRTYFLMRVTSALLHLVLMEAIGMSPEVQRRAIRDRPEINFAADRWRKLM